MKKSYLILLATSLLTPILLSSCGNKDNNEQEVIEAKYYDVNIPRGEGFIFVGKQTAKEKEDYTFKINALDGYDLSEIIVKGNNIRLIKNGNGDYIIHNVTSDITITVQNVYKNPYINLPQSTFSFNKDKIPEEAKGKQYYLKGVTSFYKNGEYPVDVDITPVDFTKVGTYTITYSIIGIETVTAKSKVKIYELPTSVGDLTIDRSNYKVSLFDTNTYGELFIDYVVLDKDNKQLTNEQITSTKEGDSNLVYFTKSYLKTLPVNSQSPFVIKYFDGTELAFNLNITDVEEPKIIYDSYDSDLAYEIENNIVLPEAKLEENSFQEVEIKYYLNNVEIDLASYKFESIGDYTYKIEVIKNGNSTFKSFNLHIRNKIDYINLSSLEPTTPVKLSNLGNPLITGTFGGASCTYGYEFRDLLVSYTSAFLSKFEGNAVKTTVKINKLLDSCQPCLISLKLLNPQSESPTEDVFDFINNVEEGKTYQVTTRIPRYPSEVPFYFNSIIIRDFVGELEIINVENSSMD